MDLSLEASPIYKETLSQEKEEKRTIHLCHSVVATPPNTNIKQTNGGDALLVCLRKQQKNTNQDKVVSGEERL